MARDAPPDRMPGRNVTFLSLSPDRSTGDEFPPSLVTDDDRFSHVDCKMAEISPVFAVHFNLLLAQNYGYL